MFNKRLLSVINDVSGIVALALMVLSVAVGVCLAQRPAMPFPGADADSFKIEQFYGSQAVITASNERVTISHSGNNCIIYIDTRVKK